MTPDKIEQMAREAGIAAVRALDSRHECGQTMTAHERAEWECVLRFASLVRASALEEAAQICEAESDRRWPSDKHEATAISGCADDIRELAQRAGRKNGDVGPPPLSDA